MTDRAKRRWIRLYFWRAEAWLRRVGAVVLVGFLLSWTRPGAWLLAVGLVAAAGLVAVRLARPSDRQIDRWLEEDLERFHPKALEALDLDEDQLERDPLRVVGPYFDNRRRVGPRELSVRRGRDGKLRFSSNRLLLLLLTEHHLGVYSCVYDSLRDQTFHISSREHPYRLVAGVELREDAEVFDGEEANSYTLRSGKTLVPTQAFILSLTSGDRLAIPVRAKIDDRQPAALQPAMELKHTVTALRAVLRAKYQPS